MYFNIFEVSEKPFQSDEEWQDETVLYEHPEILPIANHFSPKVNRDKEIEGLKMYLEENQLGVLSGDIFILSFAHRNKFYKENFSMFQETINKLRDTTLEQFSNDFVLMSGLLYDLQNSYITKHGIYIMLSSEEVIPFDEFLRRAEPDEPYYIGMVAVFQC